MDELANGSDEQHPAVRSRRAALRCLAAWIDREAAALDPGYFAMVMATGIISNAFFLEGMRTLSDVLFAVNLVAYPVLCLLTWRRAARFGAAIWGDLTNPRRVFLFFTLVAATDVLGMSIGLRGFTAVALAMWLAAFAIWFVLIYFGFGVLIFVNTEAGANVVEGAWLNGIVGTQSLVILGAAFAAPGANLGPQAFIPLHMLWSFGLALYAIFVVLLSYRIFFASVRPAEVAPPLWIVMGAAAISLNASLVLLVAGGTTPFLRAMQPFVDGVSLCLWAWATWWIPLLVLLGVWKHGFHRIAIDYAPMLWSIVFPLGMYAVATLRLSRFAAVPALASWSWIVAWIALAAWCATLAGLFATTIRRARLFAAP